jgi:TolB protein
MMKKNTVLLAVGIMFAAGTVCRAERINLESFAHNLDSIPIGILPFKSLNSKFLTRDEPWKVIADDLSFSGRFMVTSPNTIDAGIFTKNDIPLYIDGTYSVDGSFIAMTLSLNDTKSKDLLAEKKYSGEVKYLRRMAHQFSDEMIAMLFNDKGIFQSKICFVKDEGPAKNIVIMDYDGYNQRNFTSNTSINIFPVWEDSATILWTTFLRGQADIYRGTVGSVKSSACIKGRFVETSPSVSMIDGKVAFASSRDGNMEIYTCDADCSGVKRITFNKSIDTSPCWSPNGYQIAFTSDRGGSPQIYIMDADGSNTRRLTYEGSYQDSPAWSPKGDKIAYMSQGGGGAFNIWIIQTDGSNPVKLTTNAGSNEYPAWSADGSHIVYSCKNGFKSDLYAISLDGTRSKRLTNSGNAKMPDWSSY